jgi:valyl-tRNA synthetase
VPILGREIPVIADDYVDLEFGTGALKITPGHDPNDYEIGTRHGLEIISVLDEAARVNANGGPYQGQDRFECRKNIWEDMRAAGLVLKEEPYTLNVPRSQRGGEIVEPMISTQWFVHIEPLAQAALKLSGKAVFALFRNGLPRCISIGLKIFRTGVSPASCGGATASPSGTARVVARPSYLEWIRKAVANAAAQT